MSHLYIAAAHKSSGKTTVSLGLTAALVARGVAVQPFKKGPDYIDPLWLTRAAGKPCYNLDFFTQTHDEIANTFVSQLQGNDIGLIEGNKGLFDGVDVEGTDSNAALASMLAAPVVLVIDTGGITRGIAPLVRGYLDFDPSVHIAGVILNKVGGARHESKLRAALERYTDTHVLGAIGRDASLEIPERHLGLVPANETSGDGSAATTISRLADVISSSVNLDRIMEIASAAELPSALQTTVDTSIPRSSGDQRPVRIAIARDSAFGFYYPDDLDAFEKAGAELVSFDAIDDTHLPDADGLFIGGGFPETHLNALSANKSLLTDIREALMAGKPAYAECGGLMYLSRSIQWRDEYREMVGFVPADVVVGKRPQGRGYMLIEETVDSPWPRTTDSGKGTPGPVAAHEFHYARLQKLAHDPVFAHKIIRGTGIDGEHDGLVVKNLQAGFAHHRNTRANPWVERFVSFVRQKAMRA
jgi:cobyrinic acid a,c-diamide synthase